MSVDAPDMADLANSIGGPPPAAFDRLTPAERSALAAVVDQAAANRNALLDRAIEDSLRYLPGLLRGPVKRVLGV